MSKKIKWIFFLGSLTFLVGCGVKGDPQPPLTPAALGRGEPTFKDAVKEVKPVKINKEDENGR